ncbi:MAG TPA: hypothetical protein VMH49_04610 [Thermoplasmata archaeon]|nr:hypothetical protein [Thermoplasmata archaeon]
MAWAIFTVPSEHRSQLDAVLKDDLVSRQSQKVRDGPSVGAAAGTTVVLVEGSTESLQRAEGLLGSAGTKLAGEDAEKLYRRLKDEEESASAGMGLFFTEE